MKQARTLLATTLLAAMLAACDSIGEGSTLEKIEIVPSTNSTQLQTFELGDRYKAFQCLRDELLVRGTFSDGTVVNFSNRATWSSSDDAVVQVSNGDVPVTLTVGNPARDGTFYDSDFRYGPGTIIPRGTPGQSATITARFSNLSASIDVDIGKPSLRLVAVPHPDPDAVAPPYYLAEGTSQRLLVLADLDGRTVRLADIGGVSNALSINPLRWVVPAGTFVPEDVDVDDDLDQWVIDDASERIATVRASDGLVDGVKANFTPYEIYAETSLCPASTDPTLRPSADVQVATFIADDGGTAADDRLVLTREAGFHGSGFAIEDIVAGTNQQLQLRGKLDANGDGSLIVEQHLNSRATYRLLPLDEACEDEDELIGCTANSGFTLFAGAFLTAPAPTEGQTARMQACFPLCLIPRASLTADDTTVGVGTPVNFTAAAIDPPTGVTVNFIFDFGDGTTLGPQAGAEASHAYTTAGAYTATVRVVDAAHPADFMSQNAGAVRVLAGVTPPVGNAAPTAVITTTITSGDAPLSVVLNGTTSSDADANDAVTVYEFDPGDGSPVVRQTQSTLSHVYRDGTAGPFTPTLVVYDSHGVASQEDTVDTPVTVEGVAPPFLQSNLLDLRARKGILCSAEVQPTPAATPTEQAFAFPGMRFDVMGSFVADTDADTDACTDPEIGTQRITRLMNWAVRPAGVADEISDIVGVRLTGDEVQTPGQLFWFNNVTTSTLLDITATPASTSGLPTDIVVTPSQLTAEPCGTCPP